MFSLPQKDNARGDLCSQGDCRQNNRCRYLVDRLPENIKLFSLVENMNTFIFIWNTNLAEICYIYFYAFNSCIYIFVVRRDQLKI